MNTWPKSVVRWRCGRTLYLSVPFSWLMDDAAQIAADHKVGPVVAGGPAVAYAGAPWADETPPECPFDVLAKHNALATFTTRGCPNKCEFCAVPKTEGDFRELDQWKPAPVICDNNIMAASRKHFSKVITELRRFPYCDFNQGLDARLFTAWHAGEIAKLKGCKVRFAFDHTGTESEVADAIEASRKAGLSDFGVYVLVGFRDSPEDAMYRLEKVREWGIRPNPMRFQPLNTKKKNSHVADGWTGPLLAKMMHYYSRLRYVEHIPFDEYIYGIEDRPLLAAIQEK